MGRRHVRAAADMAISWGWRMRIQGMGRLMRRGDFPTACCGHALMDMRVGMTLG